MADDKWAPKQKVFRVTDYVKKPVAAFGILMTSTGGAPISAQADQSRPTFSKNPKVAEPPKDDAATIQNGINENIQILKDGIDAIKAENDKKEPEETDRLIKELAGNGKREGNYAMRENATEELKKIGKPALPKLEAELAWQREQKQKQEEINTKRMKYVIATGQEFHGVLLGDLEVLTRVENIINYLKDRDDKSAEELKRSVLKLDMCKGMAQAAVPVLIELFKAQNNKALNLAIISAWGSIGAAEALPEIKSALTNPDEEFRFFAADAVKQIGLPLKALIPDLGVALHDPVTRVRATAAEALGAMGKEVQNEVPELIATLKDTEYEVRTASAKALGDIEDKSAVDALLDVYKNTDGTSGERQAAGDALAAMRFDAIKAVPEFVKVLNNKDEDAGARRSAAHALGEIGLVTPAVLPALIGTLADKLEHKGNKEYVRIAAVRALEKQGNAAQPAIPDLQELSAQLADIELVLDADGHVAKPPPENNSEGTREELRQAVEVAIQAINTIGISR